MYNFVYVFIVAFAVELDGVPQHLGEGSKCHNTDSYGVCTLVHNCPTALKSIRASGTIGLKRCGFVKYVEIVCCPETDTPGPTSQSSTSNEDNNDNQTNLRNPDGSGTISKMVCDNYTKKLPIDVHYIVYGDDAYDGEFPHMVALGFWSDQDQEYKFNCGGTLISDDYVVTAAHCIVNAEQNLLKIVRMGTVDVPATVKSPDPKLDYNITKITLHKEYKWREKFNDIALVQLEKKVNFTEFIRPACLYTKDDDPEDLVVTGWGTIALNGEKSSILQKATLTPVQLEQCNSTYRTGAKRKIVESQICAADDRSDTCLGDSGGPIQIQTKRGLSTIVGITSYGIGCASKYPGVYTRIHSYLSWIEGIVWPRS